MLNICEIGHEPCCYEGAVCPACKLADELRARIDKLEQDIAVWEALNTITLTRQERENRRELKEFPHK